MPWSWFRAMPETWRPRKPCAQRPAAAASIGRGPDFNLGYGATSANCPDDLTGSAKYLGRRDGYPGPVRALADYVVAKFRASAGSDEATPQAAAEARRRAQRC